MKRCPECRRGYYDDTLLYCLDEGSALLEDPRSESETEANGIAGIEFMKRVFQIILAVCLLLIFAIGGIAQDAVPIEKEPMHRLKFENEFIRVFDVLIPAGAATKYHVHLFDGISVRVSNAQITDESTSGDKTPFDIKYGEATFGARPQPITHRVINTGKTDFLNIFIEILPSKNSSAARSFPILSDGHLVLIDNDRVRANRLVLKPGESSKLHTHQMHGLGIVLYDSKIELTGPDGTTRTLEPKAGDLVWQDAGTSHIIKNTGTKVFEAIDIELK